RHANLILPTSFGFERDHYDVVFYLLSVRNAARYVKALVPPPPGVRGDFEVLLDLALSLKRHGGGRKGSTLPLRIARLTGEKRLPADFRPALARGCGRAWAASRCRSRSRRMSRAASSACRTAGATAETARTSPSPPLTPERA